jgi:hypothetical protein
LGTVRHPKPAVAIPGGVEPWIYILFSECENKFFPWLLAALVIGSKYTLGMDGALR